MVNSTDFELHECQIIVTRTFEAPAHTLFAALTEPHLVRQWWGPHSLGYDWVECVVDLRPGGRWRHTLLTPEGDEFAFSGVYRTVEPPRRVVLTESYEAMPSHGYLLTLELEEKGGRTTLTATMDFQSNADRDGHYFAGLRRGLTESWEQLAKLVAAPAA